MKNLFNKLSITVFAILILFSIAACASMPAGAEDSTLAPNASSAVVYFIQPDLLSGGGDIVIWDGETPVAKIKGGLYMNVAYRAKPGVHYFMAQRFNWSKIKVDVKANNVYYIKLGWAPNPVPFANAFVTLSLLSQKDGKEQFEENEKVIAFTDEWRNEFKSELEEEELAEMRNNLKEARK